MQIIAAFARQWQWQWRARLSRTEENPVGKPWFAYIKNGKWNRIKESSNEKIENQNVELRAWQKVAPDAANQVANDARNSLSGAPEGLK